jgi:hypothetical protein
MPHEITGPILLICDEESRSYDIMGRLHRAGLDVLGPVTSAAQAMALAGQQSSTVAVVASRPTGRRDAFELARDLMSAWGISSWVLPNAGCDDSPVETNWSPSRESLARLKGALAGAEEFG